MENVKVVLDGIQKDVYGLFYIFDSKYYFIYTEKELDENDYVILYMTQVGKETQNTPNGVISTGNMIGVEITNPEEQQKIQTSISYIVEDKKNNTINPQIQYLPMNMLTNLKVVSKKRFRLLKAIMVDNFKLNFDDQINNEQTAITAEPIPVVAPEVIPATAAEPIPVVAPEVIPVTATEPIPIATPEVIQVAQTEEPTTNLSGIASNVVIDYRTKYFEEEEKNKELQEQINILTQKLDEIKKVIE